MTIYQFSERSSVSNGKNIFSVDVDLDLTVVDDVEVVALVTLLDDHLPLKSKYKKGSKSGHPNSSKLWLFRVQFTKVKS